MTLVWIDHDMLADIEQSAARSPRKRQHRNLHSDFSDPAQRVLNHVCSDSYIQPHRHALSGRDETLVAVKGLFGIVVFDSEGRVITTGCFGSERYAAKLVCPLAVIIAPDVWHSVLALTAQGLLLECKAGPFDPGAAKEMALWAPEEGTAAAREYLSLLRQNFSKIQDI